MIISGQEWDDGIVLPELIGTIGNYDSEPQAMLNIMDSETVWLKSLQNL